MVKGVDLPPRKNWPHFSQVSLPILTLSQITMLCLSARLRYGGWRVTWFASVDTSGKSPA